MSALVESAYRVEEATVRRMLAGGFDVDARGGDFNETALIAASACGHLGVVRALLDGGADFHFQGDYGETTLVNAAVYGHLEVLRVLLAHDGEVNHMDRQGNTVLMVAAVQGSLPCVVELLGWIRGRDGRTACYEVEL